MDGAAMARLLASADGGDPAALQRDLRAALGAALDEEELGERVREAVACLRSPSSRLATIARQLLAAPIGSSVAAEDERLAPGEWLVLDELSVVASDVLVAILSGEAAERASEEDPEEDEGVLWEVLALFAKRSVEKLARGSRHARWTQWCERALRAVFAVREEGGGDSEDAPAALERKKRRRETQARIDAIRAIARALLSLHEALTERGVRLPVDLKLATLVWKNLTRLTKSHASALFGDEQTAGVNGMKETDRDAIAPLNAEDVVNCVVSATENAVGQFISSLETGSEAGKPGGSDTKGRERSVAPIIGSAFKVLRVYWRAFQGHFLGLAPVLSSSTLESCVLATVNTASALIYVAIILPSFGRSLASSLSPKLTHDVDSVLQLVMELPMKMASAHDTTPPLLPRTGLTIVQTLLWYPADDMARAITQRQEEVMSEISRGNLCSNPARDGSTMDAAIRWAHWCLLVTIVAASHPDPPHKQDDNRMPVSDNGAGVGELFDKLLDRYRDDCAIKSPASAISSTMPLAIDALLQLVSQFPDFEALQLVLLKHAVHPCIDQRYACWELWKELICYCWDEDTAMTALGMLLALVEQEAEGGDTSDNTTHRSQTQPSLSPRAVDEITQLVAFMYSEMPLSLKEVCVQRVTTVIEHVCGDGPFHAFSPIIAGRLTLLDQLSSACFLRSYDHADKEEWIAKQLPMCFECCGTIIELLGDSSSSPDFCSDVGKFAGAMRVLSVCLLVFKSVYDDNDAREDTSDLMELSRILLPVMTEVLTLLARSALQASSVGGVTDAMASGRGQHRIGPVSGYAAASRDSAMIQVLRSCLYLLNKMGALVKRNQNNQCVQVMKNLLDLIDADGATDKNWEESVSEMIARFFKTALFDVQVAETDLPVVAELLTALFQRLCANEKVATKSLLGSVIAQAVYGILAHSNVARSLNIQELIPLASARHDVRQLAFLHRDINNGVESLTSSVAALMSSPAVLAVRARYATRSHNVFHQWFPSSPDTSVERADGGKNVLTGDGNDLRASADKKRKVAGQEEPTTTAPRSSKRKKLVHLVARCRQVIENCGSAADNVSDEELDRAAKVLESIIAKVLSFES